MKRLTGILLMCCAISLAAYGSASALPAYFSSFTSTYPSSGTVAFGCGICHLNAQSPGPRNPYGTAYAGAGHAFAPIENLDSDGDGFTNIVEINAGTNPGDAASHPAPAGDTTAPTVTAFSIPSSSTSLTVAVTSFTATDNVGVTGYMVTASATAPAAGATGWSATPPANFTFASAGAQTAFAWAKDAAGNVSASLSASTTITLPPTADTTAPTVTAFSIPSSSTSLTVTITSFTATDNVGVTGYMVTESATAPSASATGWSATAPASYTFASDGAKTLFAWARDAAGNVSASMSAQTTITVQTPPAGQTSVTVNAARGSGQITVETMTGGTNLTSVSAVSDSDGSINQAGKPSGFAFNNGLVTFKVNGVAIGGTSQVTLTFPSAIPSGSKVYKALADGFHEYTNAAISGNTVTLTLTDGGAGDSDGVANGSITDPVGVASPVATGGDEGGGGCTIGGHQNGPAAAADAALILLPLFVLGIMRALRRRKN
ncbi:MAG: thrombospondin type 3 repeat-containing protein [Nitrospiraceae bacterium]|nr:thrombospondin type 3 repeat-containing protein [Nitrospiraceae bacterium]